MRVHFILGLQSSVWECGDGSYIDIEKVCDNEYDCFDESDEKQCTMDPEGPLFLGEMFTFGMLAIYI